jgi:ABC-type lipopolysaccharide export system ATPase subunit
MKLRAEHLFKTYSNRNVVDDVSIEVNQGEIVGLAWSEWCRQNNDFLYYCRLSYTQQRQCFFRRKKYF